MVKVIIVISIIVYLVSILLIRWIVRKMFKLDLWSAKDSKVAFIWFVPIINLIVAIIGVFVILSEIMETKTSKNKSLRIFFNQDLID